MTKADNSEVLDTRPAERPARTAIEGRLVTIAPLDPARHAGQLYEATRREENHGLWDYLGSGPFASREDFDAYVTRMATGSDPLVYAIVENQTGCAVGHLAFLRIEPVHRVIEVGNILFAPRLQRTRAATEALYLVARHAFEALRYRRFEWKCNALNAASRAAALRLGFSFEGVFRQHMIVKGRNRDTAWFAMLDGEWPLRKAAFEQWLSDENFDQAGHQRRSLAVIREELSQAMASSD
jgi:RimJ/RimL family protein N-acetyltransferase